MSDKICVAITSRRTKYARCNKEVYKDDLCKRHFNLKMKKAGIEKIEHDGETRECSNKTHISGGSKYPKERVPIEYFYKPDKKSFFSTCLDCRNYRREMDRKNKNKLISLHEEQQKEDANFGVCCSTAHDVENVSIYPRNKVPISMFDYKYKGNTGKSINCADCRKHLNETHDRSVQTRKSDAENKGMFFCLGCDTALNMTDRAINLDGTPSSLCIECKKEKRDYDRERYRYLKNIYRSIQKDFIVRSGVSCQRCKTIILQPEGDLNRAIELATYEEKGNRYVKYKDKIYNTSDFMLEFHDLLELRVIDLDHLTEAEQRDRKIINPDEPYIEKKGSVSEMKNEHDMIQESKKCQHLCCKCHILETIERQQGSPSYSKEGWIKYEYVNNIKRSGCVICGFYDESLLKYLEMDHIDPDTKSDGISSMVQDWSYSLDLLIEECKKCRVLCKSCHRIHSDRQRDLKIIPDRTHETYRSRQSVVILCVK